MDGYEASDPLVVRYGHKLRLFARSGYVKDASSAPGNAAAVNAPTLVGIGYYEKAGRHGILNCVPPLGDDMAHLFNEDEYVVIDPTQLHAAGDIVEYGHPVVLINQNEMVWNNKTGGITGYVGPRARGIAGEMFVTFCRPGSSKRMKEKAKERAKDKAKTKDKDKDKDKDRVMDEDLSSPSLADVPEESSSSLLTTTFATEGDGPVRFGDQGVSIAVVESNRHSRIFNRRLTNFKKPTSRITGGYICCDGKGTVLRFTLCPVTPRVAQISMMNKLVTGYHYGQKIALPMALLEREHDVNTGLQHAAIEFRLANGISAVLPGTELQQHIVAHAAATATVATAQDETEFTLPLRSSPGALVLKLSGSVPYSALRKLAKTVKHKRAADAAAASTSSVSISASSASSSSSSSSASTSVTITAPPKNSVSMWRAMSGALRRVPTPVFALGYAVLVHLLLNQGPPATPSAWRSLLKALVLLWVPVFYLAVKVDHPFSSLFHASAVPGAGGLGGALGDADAAGNASLKLIVTEYRFLIQPLAPTPAAATGSGTAAAAAPSTTTTTPTVPIVAPEVVPSEPTNTDGIPRRYVLAEKGDLVKARERYEKTMAWREEEQLDSILSRPWPHFQAIKQNYPHFYHKRGNHGEPVYYEKPGKINLKALKAAGISLQDLMHNYLMVSEFLWQVLEPDDNRKCISVLDVDGIGISDFVGEAVEYVRNAAAVSGGHYPERCAYIFVINVPSWFSIIWNTVKTMVDEVTREKVIIVRGNKKKILEALADKIPMANIPAEYGGDSEGTSPEEELLFQLMAHVNGDEGAPASDPVPAYMSEQKKRRLAEQAQQTQQAIAAETPAPTVQA